MTTTTGQVQASPLGATNNIGIAQTVGGTTTQLYVATSGESSVRFDGTPVVADIVCAPPIGTGTIGLAHDNGSVPCAPGQQLGVVVSQVSGSGSGATATVLLQIAPPTGAIGLATSTPTFTPGTNVTSVVCATSYTCTNTRGEVTIVGGTATTGTIATINFSATLPAAPGLCIANQNGGGSLFDIGHGVPSTTGFTITAGVTVATATLNVDYACYP
jgi:hypothetical protein